MDGAAFCAAPDAGSDQRRSGTQDVNDPVSGPPTQLESAAGVVHVLGSTCGVAGKMLVPLGKTTALVLSAVTRINLRVFHPTEITRLTERGDTRLAPR